ncbi:unnamed protein product [Lactuca virosa]|uniref:Transmembrane protein n=1 Tax=Lactuca virosa TaxID=75947 RepID=A0AAU9LDD5_9ASTR|nr:unnamed protein product [Lactuca virosa]
MGLDAIKPSPVPTGEENTPNQSASLLSFDTDITTIPTKHSTTTVLLFSLLLTTHVALSAAFVFAFLLFSSITSTNHHYNTTALQIARPLSKFTHSVVILISSDQFRFRY